MKSIDDIIFRPARYAQPEPIAPQRRLWPEKRLQESPRWCSVDLRDGNQSLPNPMTPAQKQDYFQLLLEIGFKEIEIGFPAASQDEWNFCRRLAESKAVPEDVTISVLTQAREHVIRQTLEALSGYHKAIVHLYIPTSDLHLEFVLGQSREAVLQRVRQSVRQVRRLTAEHLPDCAVTLEFSPEEFTDSDLGFVIQLCIACGEEWEPSAERPIVFNLPSTVERALPTHYADRIEAFLEQMPRKWPFITSLHAHNDMGGAVAATELAILAGAQRVEGTLFGNGERSGNVDLVTLALNLEYLGVKTGLDFSDINEIGRRVASLTGLPVHPRSPYAGELVFNAYSGSHQDAIHKALGRQDAIQARFGAWKMPYLHIDPRRLGRDLEHCIHINSQSGKGGLAHVLESDYHILLPLGMLAELEKRVQDTANRQGRELPSCEIWNQFLHEYNRQDHPLHLINYWPRPDPEEPSRIYSEVHIDFQGTRHTLHDRGDGPVSAFAAAIRQLPLPSFLLLSYEEKSMGASVHAESITIVQIQTEDSQRYYGIGFGANIVQGAARALISALNRVL